VKRCLGYFGLVSLIAITAGVLAGFYFAPVEGKRSAGRAGPREAAAGEPSDRRTDPFGYTTAFNAELLKIGQISPKQFADRYPRPQYLHKLTFDPTAAKFFQELNAEKIKKPGGWTIRSRGEEIAWPDVELPGYKLNADELAKFKANGFVVSERLGGQTFGRLYYDIYHRDLPVFVTSDSVLHAWHRSYDAMLEELELTYLKHALDTILTAMHVSVAKGNEEYGAGVLKNSVLDADFFLAVARSLLRSEEPANDPVPSKLNQDDRVKKTLEAVQNLQRQEFELFGRTRNMDFSQFEPRGHYEEKPGLRQYFRAMMWCGRIDLRIAGGYDKTGPLSAPRELGAAVVLLDLLRRADKEEEWRKFDRCIQTFVGRTDSATFDDLAIVAAEAKVKSPADLKTDADLDKLTEAVKQSGAGKQDIRGGVSISPARNVRATLPQSFTVLGQKFTIDSWVTAKTVYSDIEWNNELVQRRVPGGLDVAFAALGNNHVVPELVERMTRGPHTWRDRKPYQHNLAAVRNVIDGLDAKMWDETIYMQWLKTLRTLSAKADDRAPEAIKTSAWAMKQANTQMASWTQLRHDTLLYVKPSDSVGYICYYPAGFVEPVVPFWEAMDSMAGRSATLLEQTPFPDSAKETQKKQVRFLRAFATQMGKLRQIAEKQLAQKELTADETKVLQDVMQIKHEQHGCTSYPRYTGWYPALFYRGPEDCVKWDAITADVHTDVPAPPLGDPGSVLHQAVGNIDLMIIAIDNGKDRVVYLGPTMSHYEFDMPGATRMTDSEWKRSLLGDKFPSRPDYTHRYLVPWTNRPPMDAIQRLQRMQQEEIEGR
jgi:hypothetical protein